MHFLTALFMWIQRSLLEIILGILTSLTLGYFAIESFRTNIRDAGIDATLVTGLITTFALIASLLHNNKVLKETRRERNFTYRMSVKSTFEQMGLTLIARMYFLNERREVCIKTMESIKDALDRNLIYKDGYGIKELHRDSMPVAILTVYFQSQADNWNKAIEIINEMGSLALTTLMNYEENSSEGKSCKWLEDIDLHIKEMTELDKKLGQLPQQIANAIIEEVNTHTLNLTKI